MAITNAQAIRFVNEQIRPVSEKIRALKYDIESILQTWSTSVQANVPNDAAEQLQDGRSAEGVSRLNGAQINSFIDVLTGLKARFDLPGVATVIDRPTVHPLSVA